MLELHINQESIKLSNRSKIVRLIAEKREITKQEIADTLKLSVPTVITNINLLLEEGIVNQVGMAESTGGRKPMIISFIPNAKYSFGVDLSPEKIRIALVNLNSIIVEQWEGEVSPMSSMEEIMEKVYEVTEEIIKKQRISKSKILGIGFSLPGLVDEEKLILENAPNLKTKNFHFKPYIKLFQVPIYIENEANVAALGEMNLEFAKNKGNGVYISITEGIGTGIIIQKYLYKSKSKKAGEFGHMRTNGKGLTCNCGRLDCWELYASEKALLQQANERFSNNIKCIAEFFSLVEKGDEVAVEVLEKYIEYLAIGIENIVLALSPEYIIIGGEISQYKKYLKEKLQQKIKAENSFCGAEKVSISFSTLNGRASLLGASMLPIQEVFGMNKQSI